MFFYNAKKTDIVTNETNSPLKCFQYFQSIDKLTYREAMTDKTKGGYLLLKRFHDNGKISYWNVKINVILWNS